MDAKSTKNNRRTKINPIFLEKSFIIAKFVNYNELINNNMEEAKGQSILDKMLTTFINTLVKAAENALVFYKKRSNYDRVVRSL